MRRKVLESDLQKLYTAQDMARIGCGGCVGCWECCRGMGVSAVLDPLDVQRLSEGLSMRFEELLEKHLELNAVDGLILPNLKMQGPEECCGFLNEKKRCSIHAFRPGICRLFPLGRLYEGESFSYFLQHQECKARVKTKVKISKWLDVPDLKRYENYVLAWHDLTEEIRRLPVKQEDSQLEKDLNVYLLQNFYIKPYGTGEAFYAEFTGRLEQMKKLLHILQKKT